MYPWFDEEDIKKLREKTAHIQDPTERTQIQNELYRKVLPIVQNKKEMANRELLKNQQAYQAELETDQQSKAAKKAGIKISDLVDTIKTKYNLPANANEAEILTQFVQQTKDWTTLLENYVNGDDPEIFYVSGLKERPVEQPEYLRREWESVWDYTKRTIWWSLQQVAAAPVSALTALGGMWENIVGKPIEWLLNKLWMNADLTTSKELQKTVLWEQAESTLAKIWEATGKLVWTAALTAWTPYAWMSTIGKIGLWATQWALWTTAYTVGWEGRLPTGKELAIWTAIGWAIPAIWAWIKAASKAIAPKLQLSWLMNPAKLDALKNQLVQEWARSPKDVGNRMIARWFKGNKQQIINDLLIYSKQSKAVKDAILTKSASTVSSPEAVKAVMNSIDDLRGVAGMSDEALLNAKRLYPSINSLDELDDAIRSGVAPKSTFTLSELDDIKTNVLDRYYNIYKQSGEVSAWLKAQWLDKIRKAVKNTIESVADAEWLGNIKLLNNETQIARWLADAIARKESADVAREILQFLWGRAPWAIVWGWVWATVWPFPSDTPTGKLGNILVGMVVGWAVASTSIKTNVAGFLSKLSWAEKSAIWAFIKSWGKTAMPKALLGKITNQVNNMQMANNVEQGIVNNISQ